MFESPGADRHFVWVVYEGATCSTVTFAEAVVVHAVLLLPLLLTSVANDGKTPLDCTAEFMKHTQTTVSNNQLVVTK